MAGQVGERPSRDAALGKRGEGGYTFLLRMERKEEVSIRAADRGKNHTKRSRKSAAFKGCPLWDRATNQDKDAAHRWIG